MKARKKEMKAKAKAKKKPHKTKHPKKHVHPKNNPMWQNQSIRNQVRFFNVCAIPVKQLNEMKTVVDEDVSDDTENEEMIENGETEIKTRKNRRSIRSHARFFKVRTVPVKQLYEMKNVVDEDLSDDAESDETENEEMEENDETEIKKRKNRQSIRSHVWLFNVRAIPVKQLKKMKTVLDEENFDETEDEEMNENDETEVKERNEFKTESETGEETVEYAVPLNENWNSLSTGTHLYDSIFAYPVDTPHVWPDPTVWNIIYAAVPADYTIPDPVFINELSKRVAWNLVQETLPEDSSSSFNKFFEALIQPPGQSNAEGTMSESQRSED